MEELIEDVAKVREQVTRTLGHEEGVDPNGIFVELEGLLCEESSVRVEKVARSIILKLEALLLKNDDAEVNLKNVVELGLRCRKDEKLTMGERIQSSTKEIDVEQDAESVISNTNTYTDEANQDGEAIDLLEQGLREDTNKVLGLLADANGRRWDYYEIYAYLEAHLRKINRVQIVVEELLGMVDNMGEKESRSPSPQLSHCPSNVQDECNGKGKGRSIIIGDRVDIAGKADCHIDGKPVKRDHSPVNTLCKRLKLKECVSKLERTKPEEEQQSTSSPLSTSVAASNAVFVDEPREVVDINKYSPEKHEDLAKLAENVASMFPDTPFDYILARCQDILGKTAAINSFTEELLSSPHPPTDWRLLYKTVDIIHDHAAAVKLKSEDDLPSEIRVHPVAGPSSSEDVQEVDPLVNWETEKQEQLVSMLPSICPDWLFKQVEFISRAQYSAGENNSWLFRENDNAQPAHMEIMFETKVEELFSLSPEERGNLPTRAQWEVKKKQMAELKKWSGNMSVKDLLELYGGNPGGYFNDPERKPKSEYYKQHVMAGLQDEFRFHSITEIRKAFKKGRYLYTPAFKSLKQLMRCGKNTRKTRRNDYDFRYPTELCIEFLKEKKFCELEDQITAERARIIADREAAVEGARERGDLVECECCFSADWLQLDMVQCKAGHMFCKECISRGTSVAIGDGKTVIECLGQCPEEVTWQELQNALAPNVLSKILQRRQAEEVGSAGLENLVTCPFCPYQTIMENADDKILACRNPDCGRNSCRLCKESNHVPLRCDEVKKRKGEEEVRKNIEEQLTEAMIRECWKCRARFLKEEGCNKMTCPKCGSKMCYLCKEPVNDYTHFYGQGGEPSGTRKCPLWIDSKQLHAQEVASAAAKAKEELAKSNISFTFEHDPTEGFKEPSSRIL